MARLKVSESLAGGEGLGAERRTLRAGRWEIAIEGLDAGTAGDLDRRWGGFVTPDAAPMPDAAVRLLDAGPGAFLEAEAGEAYRFEMMGSDLVSYHLAARREGDERWVAAIASSDEEPRERILDNLARLLVARVALRAGGFPLHGAGIVRRGRAFIFAGPSRAGKSTAARLAAPDLSLGDDFAVVVPHASGHAAVAVPFDNGARGPADAPPPLTPLHGLFRLQKSGGTPGIDRLAGPRAIAGLIGCAAFPWAVPDLADLMLPAADGIVRAGLLAELRFDLTTDVAALIDGAWYDATRP